MGIIRKAYDKGEKLLNNIREKTQNPLREFEKELNNLKALLKETKSLSAHYNALKIRAEKDIPEYIKTIKKYGKKAKEAVKSAEKNIISEKTAETIALNALKFKKTFEKRLNNLKNKTHKYEEEIKILKEKTADLRLKIEYYENKFKFLKKQTKSENKEKISDYFYGDEGVITKLEKLKDNIFRQNEKAVFFQKHSNELYDKIEDAEIIEEYENLKKTSKK